MTTAAPGSATLEDLYRVEGKAELIGGRIVHFMASGHAPSRVALRVAFRLDEYAQRTGVGVAYGDGIGFALVPPLPNGRQSFSPDAAYYDGPLPSNLMRFIEGVPTLAVEVRSEGDYGAAAELELADKRADYFLAGTLVVLDADPLAETVAVYSASAPDKPTVYSRGQIIEAEPAAPGWRLPVDELFSEP